MKFKTGDEARVKRTNKETMYKHIEGTTVLILNNVCGDLYKVCDCIGGQWILDEEMLEPIVPTLSEVKDGKIDCIVHTRTQEEANILYEELGSDSGWHRPANECWQYYNKDTWYIIQNGLVHQFGDEDCRLAYPSIPTCEFSDLFATGGTLPTSELLKKEFNVTWIDKIALPTATETKEMVERVRQEILKFTNAFPKEEKKMPTKFTFYVKEGTRPDKKCNGLIPTMTTTVVDASGKKATVTCDKADYSERQGVLEAIAQMACGGNFDKEYDKAVKKNNLIELHDRTCTYYGKVFDTVEELKAHEAWHVERKKARRERYLLRKRAKEIAFEEAAQKIAKEMIDAKKGDK